MQERIVSGMMREENLGIHSLPWNERLTAIMEMMREMSSQTDPQQMVQQYGAQDAPGSGTSTGRSRSAGAI